ncbi:MAG: hypothetical protein OHK0046_32450 [Anaerolineae bacterium]
MLKKMTILLIVLMCGVLVAYPLVAQTEEPADAPAAEVEAETELEEAAAEGAELEVEEVGEVEEPAEEEESPTGVGLLMLLTGIASVAAVGFAMIGRDNAGDAEAL